MNKYTPFLIALLVLAQPVAAFTLTPNAQCTGGTLVSEYADVMDGGGLGPYTNARALAGEECNRLTPAGGCCSVQVSTNGGGFGGTIIPYTWFNYQIFQGGTVQRGAQPGQTGPLANQPGTQGNSGPVGRQYKYFAGPDTAQGTSPLAVQVSLVANPTSIQSGEASLLTWSSSGAATCVANFDTGGALNGTVSVRPGQTTTYSVTCSAAGQEVPAPPATVPHTEGELFTSSPVKQDMQTNGGVAFTETTFVGRTLAADQVTMNRVCTILHGPGATATQIGARGYKSPKNNGVIKFDGTKWASIGAKAYNSHLSGSFSCLVSGGTVTQPGASASARATVTVGTGLSASCRAHPSRAAIGEDVLWSSSVSGPQGTYTYLWSGSEGLSGTGDQVFKKYAEPGTKTASLQVTYYPPGVTPKVNTPPNTQCQGEEDPSLWGGGLNCMAGEPVFGVSCPAGERIQCDTTQTTRSCQQNTRLGLNPFKFSGNACRCVPCSNTQSGTQSGGATGGSQGTLPPLRGQACPAIAWAVPITPCSGVWSPSLDTNGCQSGWQCMPYPAGSTSSGSGGFIDTIFDSFKLINFETPFFIPRVAYAAAGGQTAPHTEGELFTSSPVKQDMQTNGGVAFTETTFVGRTLAADQVTMNRVCTILHGPGATATQIGARGYKSCKNNGIIQFNGSTWASVSGCAGAHLSGSFSCVVPGDVTPPTQCGVGQSQTRTLSNMSGDVRCEGGTIVYRDNDTLDGASFGGNLQDVLTSAIQNSGTPIPDGACAMLSFRSGNSIGGGYPPNSMLQITVHAGGQLVSGSGGMYGTGAQCTNGTYTCGSMAGIVSTACGVTPPQDPDGGVQTITVQCENGVTIAARTGEPQCSDGKDNNGDGKVDQDDPGCLKNGVYDPNGREGKTQCADGIDNNGDGNVDFPDDPGCTSFDDDSERAEPADLTLTATPPLVKKNSSCTLAVSAKNVKSCALSGPGISRTFSASRGSIDLSQVVTPSIAQTSTYTLSCNALDGKQVKKSVDCKVAPTFQEI